MIHKNCKGCIHLRSLGTNPKADLACHYFLDTYDQRGCPPEKCTKKETDPLMVSVPKKKKENI